MRKNSWELEVWSLEKIFIFLAAVILSFSNLGCAKKEIKNISSKGKEIICFGDSITMGYGVEKGEDFPTLLGKKVTLPVFNMGIDGDTTVDGMKRINTDVLDKDPVLVIIEFGGNDFLKKVPKEKTLANLREMIDLCQEKGAMVAVADISAGMFFREYRIAFRKIAQEKGAIFIPGILNGIITNPMLKSDFFHPNVKGYQVVCDRIFNAIQPYLEQNKQKKDENL